MTSIGRVPLLRWVRFLIPPLILACGEAETVVEAPSAVPTTLAITPPSAVLASLGQTVQLTATVRDQTGTLMPGVAVNWASSDGGIVAVDGEGVVTAAGNGTANVTATVRGGGASGSVAITVAQQVAEVRLTPASQVLRAIGATLRVSAGVFDANGHPVVDAGITWESSDEAVVTVSAEGLVTAKGNGSAQITASSDRALGVADFSVEQEISEVRLTPDPQIFRALGETFQLSAEVLDANGHPVADVTVSWASNDESVVTVSSSGLVTAIGNGSATVSASSDPASATANFTVEQKVASLTVSPDYAVLSPQDTVRLTAAALDANGNAVADAEVTWLSDDESAVTVDATGLVTGVARGSAGISAQSPTSGLIASAWIVVVVLQDPAQISYASSLGVDLSAMDLQSSGLYIRDLQEGEGEPAVSGDVMVVHYSGWLNDGTLFDSSHTRNQPFAVPTGAGRVIDGWEEGLPGMRVGGVRQLVIPPQLAYGAQSPSPLIPAGSVLIFEVELLEVNPGS